MHDNGGRSFAGINLLSTGVDRADIPDHIGDDCVLRAGRVLVIHHNPWHIGMGGVKLVSGLSKLVHDVVSLLSIDAAVDRSPVHTVLGGTALSLSHKVSGIVLEAEGEWETLTVVVELADGAGLNHVALALTHTVLAGEGPARSVLGCFGIAVRYQVEVADLPEVLGIGSILERPADESETIGT